MRADTRHRSVLMMLTCTAHGHRAMRGRPEVRWGWGREAKAVKWGTSVILSAIRK